MDITTFIENTAAVLEFVFFLLTMYSLVTGLRTKNYDNLKKYGIMYLILNLIRRIYTFAMLIGRRASALLYCFEVLFPFIWVAVVAFFGKLPLWSLLVLVAMVPAVKNSIKAMRFPSAGAKALYGVDEATAQLQLMFSLLLTISLFIPLFL